MSITRIPFIPALLLFMLCQVVSATDLGSALAEAGWSVTRSGDNELIIRPRAQAETEAARPAAASMVPLRRQLEATGWQVRETDDGSLIVHRPPPVSPPDPGTGMLDPEARKRLEQAGWQLREEVDGSLVLTPPTAKPEPAAIPDPMETLASQLQAAGWSTRHADDGSLLLFPSATDKTTLTSSLERQPVTPMSEDLQEQLRSLGWRVQQKANGELLLYPPAQEHSTVIACPGVKTDTAVQLPVDSFEEAVIIAQKWLETQPLENVTTGRVRRILRVHLVSIVNASRPHRLRHQIAIRNRDGAVIVLD